VLGWQMHGHLLVNMWQVLKRIPILRWETADVERGELKVACCTDSHVQKVSTPTANVMPLRRKRHSFIFPILDANALVTLPLDFLMLINSTPTPR